MGTTLDGCMKANTCACRCGKCNFSLSGSGASHCADHGSGCHTYCQAHRRK